MLYCVIQSMNGGSKDLTGGTAMIYTALTKKAMKVAYEAHHGQTDRSGTPYIFHPFHVAEQMDDELSVCTALLHDVIEDTEITFEDLTGEFPEEVVEALRCLTRDKNKNYFDYIRNLRKNPIAKKVKQADLLHNSDVTRLSDCENMSAEQISRLHGRYKRALEILHDARGYYFRTSHLLILIQFFHAHGPHKISVTSDIIVDLLSGSMDFLH